MAFSENTMTALRSWIGIDTWHTGHLDDDNRFYDFIYALWEELGIDEGLDEAYVREIIAQEAHEMGTKLHPEDMEREMEERVSFAVNVLWFLKRARRRRKL